MYLVHPIPTERRIMKTNEMKMIRKVTTAVLAALVTMTGSLAVPTSRSGRYRFASVGQRSADGRNYHCSHRLH